MNNVRFERLDKYFKSLYYTNKMWFESRLKLNAAQSQELSQLLDKIDWKVEMRIKQILKEASENN